LGACGAFASEYGFTAPAAPAKFAKCLKVLGNYVCRSDFLGDIERERSAIKSEFYGRFSNREFLDCRMKGYQRLFKESSWLSRMPDVFGTLGGIEAVRKEDLKFFHDSYYVPANMTIVSVGGMSVAKLKPLIAGSPFGFDKAGSRQFLPVPASRIDSLGDGLELELDLAQKPSSSWIYSWGVLPGIYAGGDYEILRYMIDRALTESLRLKLGLVYQPQVTFVYEGQYHKVGILLSGVELGKEKEVRKILNESIASMPKKIELFSKVKRGVILDLSNFDQSGHDMLGWASLGIAQRQKIMTMNEYVEKAGKLTIKDIDYAAQCLLPENRVTITVRA
jgi:predicted Zn-dependent peptidase